MRKLVPKANVFVYGGCLQIVQEYYADNGFKLGYLCPDALSQLSLINISKNGLHTIQNHQLAEGQVYM